jgi:hypothetical protein
MKQMKQSTFHALLREVFRASLATPLVLVACGGAVSTTADAGNPAEGDGSTVDTGADGPIVHGRSPGCSTSPPDGGIVTCSFQLALEGDPASCGLTVSGPNDAALCAALCHESAGCQLVQNGAGNLVQCFTPCGTGRRPAGFAASARRRSPRTSSVVARWWAEVAALEEASVGAFRILRRELVAHQAPSPLVRAAERAAQDEVRHARATAIVARRHGVEPRRSRIVRRPVRPLEAIATENAVEGCVRETFGALVALWQARSAADPRVRATMKRIAADEARHAELAWRVAQWLEPKLDAVARERVSRARTAAIAQLRTEVQQEPARALVESAGLPTAAAAISLLENARALLWKAA